MKLILTILFFSIWQGLFATNYYVSNSGSDANNGLTTGTAWQTLSKVNGFSFSSGDSILFKRGDSWNETLRINHDSIYVGAYGIGVKPLVTALQTVAGFTDSSNVWKATISNSVADLNTVLVDGKIRAKARNPNTGYTTFTSYLGKNKIVGADTSNHVGADICVKMVPWIIDRSRISSQSGDTLNLRDALAYATPNGGNGYFIQNQVKYLDAYGEWTFDSTTKVLRVYSTTTPVVQYSILDTLLSFSHRSNVTIDGLSFQGANQSAIHVDSSDNITIKNCSINFSGDNAISGRVSSYITIAMDSIQNTLNDAVYFFNYNLPFSSSFHSDYLQITNNYIKNTGFLEGMARKIAGNANATYTAIIIMGLQPTISGNVIDSTGYIPIEANGKKTLIKNNVVSNYNFTKDDGGGIYMGVGSYFPADYNDSSRIVSNIVYNAIGAKLGVNVTWNLANGIYADDGSRYITIDSNTVFNTENGIYLHNNSLITITNNNLYKNRYYEFRDAPLSDVQQSLVFKHNQMYSDSLDNLIYQPINLSISNIGVIDSNYYSHPNYESSIVFYNTTDRSLPAWQSFSGQDSHSIGTASGITSARALLKYSSTTQTFPLTGDYYDMKGIRYSGSITLQPFTSAILFKTTIDIKPKYPLKMRKITK